MGSELAVRRVSRVTRTQHAHRTAPHAPPGDAAMKRLFGAKKAEEPPPSLEEASANVGKRGDAVDEKIRKLDAELVKYREQMQKARGPAKEHLKQRAMKVLQQKRMYENQRDQLYNQQFNLDQVAFTTQNLKDTTVQVQAMTAANKEIQRQFKTNKNLDISAIEKMQDEMQDLIEDSNYIQEALSANHAMPDDIDEDELLGELDALELDLQTETEAGGAVPSYLVDDDTEEALPSAPTATLDASGAELPSAPQGTTALEESPVAQKI